MRNYLEYDQVVLDHLRNYVFYRERRNRIARYVLVVASILATLAVVVVSIRG